MCDSPLWKYIPGGWKALVDENNPKHLMAKFAYIPKVIKTSNDAKQPQTTLDSDLLPTLRTGDTDFFSGNGNAECGSKSTLNTSTYLKLGPYEQYQPVEKNDVCSYHNNTPTELYTSYHEKGQESWVGNLEIRPEDPNLIPGTENISDQTLCSIDDGNEINSNNNRSVWGKGISGDNNSAVNNIKSCNFNFWFFC